MFDQTIYNTFFQAAHEILKNNGASLGREFCEGFMADHDIRRGQGTFQNAQNFFNAIATLTQRTNNSDVIRDDNQLFEFVGIYIKEIYNIWQQARMNQSRGMGFGGGGGFGGSSMGGGFTGGSLMGGNRGGSGFGGFGANQRMGPGAHLGDVIEPRNQQESIRTTQTAAPVAATASPLSFSAPQKDMVVASNFSANPLDDLSEQGITFSPVTAAATWGDEKAKDLRIVIGRRVDMKTRDVRYSVAHIDAYHQAIMDDPMQVARDFFAIVPDSTLGSSFLCKIFYNHLDIIDVPTQDFIEVRNRCIEAVSQDSNVLIHKKIAEVINDMKRGPYVAMTQYLTKHVNRALHLACRLSSNPAGYIKIDTFEDINELLSSSFNHDFTTYPEGRHKLEKIVGAALWNALVMGSNAMFTGDEDFPTQAVQFSPAFPYSMEGVYPNKYAIPTPSDATMSTFMEHLKDKELSRRTYILSKRSVVVTNIFGRKVLGAVGRTPALLNTPLASLINECIIPFPNLKPDKGDAMKSTVTALEEGFPSDQLENYYANVGDYDAAETTRYSRVAPTLLPVDQTIFAVQYGVSAKEYLMAFDVFSTIDGNVGADQTILAKKKMDDVVVTA